MERTQCQIKVPHKSHVYILILAVLGRLSFIQATPNQMSKTFRTLLGIVILVGLLSAGGDLGLVAILVGLLVVAQLFFD